MRIVDRKMTEDMRVNSWQGGQENNIFCKDMKTHSFHDQILAVGEIMLKEN